MLGIRRKNIRWVDIDMAEVKLGKLIVHYRTGTECVN